MSIAASYVNATTFTATSDAEGAKDLTGQCAVGTRIRADCGTDGYKYGVVSSVGYSDPTTTIVMSGDSLTSNLVSFDHGNDSPDSIPVASASTRGGVVLATAAETVTGADAAKATTPAGVAATLPNPNLLINSDFRVSARGTSFSGLSTTRTYTLDRWAVTTGAGTLAGAAQTATVPSGSRAKYSLELTGASGVTTVDVDQRLEALEAARANGTVTFSARVYNGADAAFAPVLLLATPSAADIFSSKTVQNGSGSGEALQSCAAGAWTSVTWTADASAYANLANGLEVRLRIPSGALGTAGAVVRLTELTLEPGPAATPYAPQPIEREIASCQRFYVVFGGSYLGIQYVGYGAIAGAYLYLYIAFPVQMRAAPTATKAGTWGVGNSSQPSVAGTTTKTVGIYSTSVAAGIFQFYTLDATTYLALDAEL